MKAMDGSWHGLSIDLWQRIAEQLHFRYRFVETSLDDLTNGVAEGSLTTCRSGADGNRPAAPDC